jgi:serpin B
MKWTRIAFVLASLAIVAGCELVSPEGEEDALPILNAAEKNRVAEANSFGFELLQELVKQEKDNNVIISPLSVSLALGMTLNGAAGTTYDEMAEVLGMDSLSEKEINDAYRTLLDLLPGLDPAVDVELANSIWHREDLAVEAPFVEANQTYFDAEVRSLDFGSPQAIPTINGWIAEKTHNRIQRVIERMDRNTVMYLINALYFDAAWRVKFDRDLTAEAPFHLEDGASIPVQMMSVKSAFATYNGEGYRVIDIPYGDSLYSMTILLPDEPGSLDGLVAHLTASEWDTILSGLTSHEVTLYLPRFDGGFGTSLKESLIALGMEQAFDASHADLTRIDRRGGLWVDDVIHKTAVRWDEEGTEAAAVTVVVVSRLGGDEVVFRVDRPFLCVIRERHSGTVMFLGAIRTPS